MRVYGNSIPEAIQMEPYGIRTGLVEIRLRENIQQGEAPGTGDIFYCYDEYVFRLPEQPELEGEIRKNLKQWLLTGRMLETRENASALCDLRQALEIRL